MERDIASFPVGAVRMTESFLSDGDPDRRHAEGMQRLRDHVAGELAQAAWLAGHGGQLVGTGGAVRNLAAAAQRAQFGSSGGTDIGIQGFVVSAEALGELVGILARCRWATDVRCPGSSPGVATSSWPQP